MSLLTDTNQSAARQALQYTIVRTVFGIYAVTCCLAVVAVLVMADRVEATAFRVMLGSYLAMAALGLAGLRIRPAWAGGALTLMVVSTLLLVGANSAINHWGFAAPGLLFFGLLVAIANVAGTRRASVLSVVLAMAVVLALALGQWAGWLAPQTGRMPPMPLMLLAHLLAIGTGAAVGRAVVGLMARFIDTVERREDRFRTLLGIATVAYWEMDEQLRLRRIEVRNAQRQFRPVPNALGQTPWTLPALLLDAETDQALRRALADHLPMHDLPVTWRLPDGRLRHLLAHGEPRLDAEGRFLGFWGVARDVTAQHRAQQALQATESRYQELFMRTPSALVLHRDGLVLDANPAAARLLGYAGVDELLGHDILREHMDDGERRDALDRLARLAGTANRLPETARRLHTRSGQPVLTTAEAVQVQMQRDGQPAVLAMFTDETARHAAAQALQRSEALLSLVVSMSPDVITLTDLQTGRYVMVNDSFCRLLGRSAAQVVGRTSVELDVWRDPADRDRLVQGVTRDGAVRDHILDFKAANGRVVSLVLAATRLARDGRDYLLVNARDVTDVQRLQQEREAMLANASIGIAFTRAQRFELANPFFERMLGWAPGTLAGQPGAVVWPSPQDYQALGAEVGPALARGEAVQGEREALRRDGSRFTMRFAAKAIDLLRPVDGGTIWIAEDVTGARQAAQELARARDAAEAANQAKSAFLASTSHEIRTPLNGLLGMARLARQPDVDAARLRLYLDQIAESAETLSQLISDILDLSRIEAGKLEVENAPFALDALLHSLQQAYGALADAHGLGFETRFDPALPAWVHGDAMRLRQVLVNLLHNALKFTRQGQVALHVHGVAGPPGTPGPWLRFEVRDTGPGIEPAALAQLFQPFTQADQSITRRFGGSGLGLSISRQLVQLMGGQIGVDSQPGQGSCFYLLLPLPAAPAATQAGPASQAAEAALRGVRVMLVEDNAVNMVIGVSLLEHWGFVVTQAEDGLQALAALDSAQAAGQPIQVVLMDVQMPGLSGYDTTRRLRQRWSAQQLPVIALTAAALTSERDRAAACGMTDFITKPVDPARLRAALVRAMTPAASAPQAEGSAPV
ncbi:PAS domain S-box protein [Aquabacterium sp. OR-4]|uniref:PAS domain S-box protein n=1 Tax=Aquabacterium sp. OR-4 TaxID=2978127 RepID=UPI0028CAC831|nr:PAS domain S-box protein [Aquabacterium sp. OR-4]MDT7834014.1 PAS domain S-box protein [Aquabacterium sp. OR-4]